MAAVCSPTLTACISAIQLRRTHRDGFVGRALPTGLSDELRALAYAEGAWLALLGEDERARVADLVAEGDRMQWANRHWRRELAAWLHPRRRGVLPATPGLIAPLTHAAVATLDIGMPTAARDRERTEQEPGHRGTRHARRPPARLADRRDGARARPPARRVQGPQAAFLNQPIQLPELRLHVAALLDRPCFPQAIVQLGYPTHPAKPTPRRPLADVMTPLLV